MPIEEVVKVTPFTTSSIGIPFSFAYWSSASFTRVGNTASPFHLPASSMPVQ